MTKVKLTITESKCRGGYCKKGDEFIAEDLCPRCAMNYGISYIHMYLLCRMEK